MIRAIANKKLDLSNTEYGYYQELKNAFGEDSFKGVFTTDANGHITSITPSTTQPMAMAIIFFLLNVMLNQRLRKIDTSLSQIEEFDQRLKKIEEKLNL